MTDSLMCPACGSAEVKKLFYTPQGGILWTPFLGIFKCRACGVRFSGKTGEVDPQIPKMMRIISVIVILAFVGLLIGFALSLSSMRQTETNSPSSPPRVNVPTPRR